jgi:hypothetical protein
MAIDSQFLFPRDERFVCVDLQLFYSDDALVTLYASFWGQMPHRLWALGETLPERRNARLMMLATFLYFDGELP